MYVMLKKKMPHKWYSVVFIIYYRMHLTPKWKTHELMRGERFMIGSSRSNNTYIYNKNRDNIEIHKHLMHLQYF